VLQVTTHYFVFAGKKFIDANHMEINRPVSSLAMVLRMRHTTHTCTQAVCIVCEGGLFVHEQMLNATDLLLVMNCR
jgi:hypothetical protein